MFECECAFDHRQHLSTPGTKNFSTHQKRQDFPYVSCLHPLTPTADPVVHRVLHAFKAWFCAWGATTDVSSRDLVCQKHRRPSCQCGDSLV